MPHLYFHTATFICFHFFLRGNCKLKFQLNKRLRYLDNSIVTHTTSLEYSLLEYSLEKIRNTVVSAATLSLVTSLLSCDFNHAADKYTDKH